ncbi:FkbM family methyltransferase, partial [Campylobacter sp. CX2-4080-23]|uniref:FkbM family methyltransferase n=1 Tax=Campylobacter porcelli TaxID=1660073 RepID=UPI002EAEF777|nr:FkbM family methyltransferase [Campylobacter sp. CX2-4080-23]
MNIDNRDIVNLSMGGGISYMIYLPNKDTDYIQNKIYKETEPYEVTMLKDIISRCKSNDIIVDVGSNIGNHTIFFAANNLFVYAFEANSALFNIMQDSIKLNKFDNLTKCYNVAVSDSVSKAKFSKLDETNLGGQSLAISDDGDIPTIPLDDVDFNGKVAVVKIDVEGMECNVLNGAKKLIAKDRPLLYIEAINMDSFKNISYILNDLNYVYWDTFNATPTHLFLPKETLCEKDILTNSLNHQIFESYRIKQSLNYSKRHQNDINKVIDLSTKSIKLLEDKIETLEKEKESFLSIQDEKNQELLKIKYEKFKLEDKIETLENDFDKMKTNFIGMKARYQKELQDKNSVLTKNKTLNNSIEKLKTNFEGMEARNKKLLETISKKDDEIYRIKNMLSFRLGHALIQSTKSFQGFIKLPFNIYNEYRKYKSYIKSTSKNINYITQNKIDLKTKKNIDHIDDIKKIKIAAIMDEFTYNSFKYECDLLQLTLNNWKNEISNFNPDMVFIESAWKGKDDSWATKISNCSKELIELIQWCNDNKIKTIFWNKEDPVHFNTFLNVAKIVDYVFTTDIDCIGIYKYHLKHNNVYLLPFAAQPDIHNPIEKYKRKDAFNFAGSYYLRYPQRQIDFNTLINSVKDFKDIEIYDRNFDNPHPHYTFPPKFKHMILGKLSPTEIDKAYKGYKFGINMNTIKQSQTMFARRVFELLASNTIVVSNFSRGVRNFFGDLVISSDDKGQIVSRLKSICDDELYYQKFRLLGLRKVMQEHTYYDRLSFILSKVFNHNANNQTINTIILSIVNTNDEYNRILDMFNSQTYPNKTLFIISPNHIKNQQQNIHIFKNIKEALKAINDRNSFIGLFDPNDYYGKNYINDIILATKYSKCDAIGKSCHYEFNSDMVLKNQKDRYTYVNELNLTSSLCSIKKLSKDELKDIVLSNSIKFDNMLSIDEFNYCKNGINASNQDLEEYIQDLEVSNSGISFNDEVYSIIDKIPPTMEIIDKDENLFNLAFDRLYDLLKHNSTINTKFSISNNKLIIDIKLAPKKHKYIYTDKVFTKEELNLVTNSTINLKSISTLENLYTV